jgi:hypothetical protein
MRDVIAAISVAGAKVLTESLAIGACRESENGKHYQQGPCEHEELPNLRSPMVLNGGVRCRRGCHGDSNHNHRQEGYA